MRTPEDIVVVNLAVSGTVEIDLERVEQDPLWDTVARTFDIDTPEGKKAALEAYLCRYLGHEVLLEEAPITNGPAAVIGTSAEVKTCLK
jgi:hypothetical protein